MSNVKFAKIFIFMILISFQPIYNNLLLSQNLDNKQLKEFKELILLVDIIDVNLKKIWNASNDYGVRNNKDYNYAENTFNVSKEVYERLLKLPKGKYQEYLQISLKAYLDVGLMRLLIGDENGFDKQTEIAKLYQIQDSEPHLWAWCIWEIARVARNKSAKELNLPVLNYSDED